MAKEPKVKKTREEISRICSSSVKTSKSHERRIANLLTDWSGVPFRRRRIQGREGALRMAELAADVIPTAGDFNFSIECKKEKGFSLDGLMANPRNSLFTGWWHQATYDAMLVAQDLGRPVQPMLFFKPHPNHDWVAFPIGAELKPKEGYGGRPDGALWFPHARFDEFMFTGPIEDDVSHSGKHPKMVSIYLPAVVMCRWRDFEAWVDPKSTFTRFPTAEEIEKACLEDKGLQGTDNGVRV